MDIRIDFPNIRELRKPDLHITVINFPDIRILEMKELHKMSNEDISSEVLSMVVPKIKEVIYKALTEEKRE